MVRISPLPRVMVALNGAHRTKEDHLGLPILVSEIITDVEACIRAGATGFHVHARDDEGKHSLNVRLNKALLTTLEPFRNRAYIQLTTEQAGIYQVEDQLSLLQGLPKTPISVGFREVFQPNNIECTLDFYRLAQMKEMDIQHIFYSPSEIGHFEKFWKNHFGIIDGIKMLFVLGSYDGKPSNPADVGRFLRVLEKKRMEVDWAVCAFGMNETTCLLRARELGGKVRIGFENSTQHPDGRVAESNADRVRHFLSLS